MRIQLLAIGRLKLGPERELVERYRERVASLCRGSGISSFDLIELPEGRERQSLDRQTSEAGAIRAKLAGARMIAFDERGASMGSATFADRLGRWRDGGRAVSLVIGGPDGLSETIRREADLVLSFGALTLPHQLVRVLVVEQVYRALTILSGHPYHRGEPGRD